MTSVSTLLKGFDFEGKFITRPFLSQKCPRATIPVNLIYLLILNQEECMFESELLKG